MAFNHRPTSPLSPRRSDRPSLQQIPTQRGGPSIQTEEWAERAGAVAWGHLRV